MRKDHPVLLQRSIVVHAEQWKRAKFKALEMDINVSEAIRQLLLAWVNDEIEVKRPEKKLQYRK